MAQFTAREAALLSMVKRLTHFAMCLNGAQHAGNPIAPEVWSDLYRLTAESQALLARYRQRDAGAREAA